MLSEELPFRETTGAACSGLKSSSGDSSYWPKLNKGAERGYAPQDLSQLLSPVSPGFKGSLSVPSTWSCDVLQPGLGCLPALKFDKYLLL